MGGGSSNSKLWSLFVNAELVDGSKYLAGDPQFRSVFIEYVRSGQWKERLSSMVSEDQLANERFSSMEHGNVWLKYKCPPGIAIGMGQGLSDNCIQSPRNSKKSLDYVSDKSICAGFTTSQLTSVMFSILYPLFASTPDDDCTPHSYCGDVRSNHITTEHAQDILSACVEELSEEDMDDFLEYPKWVFETSETFEDFPFSITICDTSRPGCPIIYANKAFQTLSGYALVDLLGSGLDILHGPATQAEQVDLLQEAVTTGQPAKIGVTHYTKKQKPFLNLITMRSCAHYAVSVHFAATRSAHSDDIKAIEDLLLLVCCVLQAPLLKPVVAAPAAPVSDSPSIIRRSLDLVKRSFEIHPHHPSKNIRNSVSTRSGTRSSVSSNSSCSFNSTGASDKSAINLARLMAVRMSMNESACGSVNEAAENDNEYVYERKEKQVHHQSPVSIVAAVVEKESVPN